MIGVAGDPINDIFICQPYLQYKINIYNLVVASFGVSPGGAEMLLSLNEVLNIN